MCVLIFSTILSETFLILTRNNLQIIINVHRCPRKVPVILGQILMKLEFSGQIFEKKKVPKHQIWWKSVQWTPSCSMRTDGRTDTTKLKVVFHNSLKALTFDLHRVPKRRRPAVERCTKRYWFWSPSKQLQCFYAVPFETWFEPTEQLTLQLSANHTNQSHVERNCESVIFSADKGLEIFKADRNILANNKNQ